MTKRTTGDDQARAVKTGLEQLEREPPAKRYTRRDVIRENFVLIESLRRQGHGWDAIARTISKHGLSISAHTVRQYVQSERLTQKPAASGNTDGPSAEMSGEGLRPEAHAGEDRLVSGAGERMDTREDVPARLDPVSGPKQSNVTAVVSKEAIVELDKARTIAAARPLIRDGCSMTVTISRLIEEGAVQVPTEFLAEAAEQELGKEMAQKWLARYE